MRMLTIAALAACGLLLAPGSPRAAAEPEQLVQLVEAYQGGYLQVVAIACYQIYSSTGLVATAFAEDELDGPAALEQLAENSLLHSVCYSTLLEIQNLTPASDKAARSEIERLAKLLVLEDELLTALADVFARPDEAASRRVEQARLRLATALDEYAGVPAK